MTWANRTRNGDRLEISSISASLTFTTPTPSYPRIFAFYFTRSTYTDLEMILKDNIMNMHKHEFVMDRGTCFCKCGAWHVTCFEEQKDGDFLLLGHDSKNDVDESGPESEEFLKILF